MKRSDRAVRFLVALSCAVVTCGVFASAQQQATQKPPAGQQQQKPYEPTVGQAGKDVVWVPTSDALVAKMLDLANVTAQDFVMDLGSGDGRTVIAAAKRGAHAMGIEYNPDMVALSQHNAEEAGVSDKVSFVKADLFETDFSKATVITMFLLPDINMKLRPKILGMKPGTRVVSNSFTMEDWEPDEDATVTEGCSNWCHAMFWIVPAKVDGVWQFPNGELTIKQQFQHFTGSITMNGVAHQISDGKLRGDQITFTVEGVAHTGTVAGDRMAGTITGGSGQWTATRK
jgi:precorrin-6B methylase 2